MATRHNPTVAYANHLVDELRSQEARTLGEIQAAGMRASADQFETLGQRFQDTGRDLEFAISGLGSEFGRVGQSVDRLVRINELALHLLHSGLQEVIKHGIEIEAKLDATVDALTAIDDKLATLVDQGAWRRRYEARELVEQGDRIRADLPDKASKIYAEAYERDASDPIVLLRRAQSMMKVESATARVCLKLADRYTVPEETELGAEVLTALARLELIEGNDSTAGNHAVAALRLSKRKTMAAEALSILAECGDWNRFEAILVEEAVQRPDEWKPDVWTEVAVHPDIGQRFRWFVIEAVSRVINEFQKLGVQFARQLRQAKDVVEATGRMTGVIDEAIKEVTSAGDPIVALRRLHAGSHEAAIRELFATFISGAKAERTTSEFRRFGGDVLGILAGNSSRQPIRPIEQNAGALKSASEMAVGAFAKAREEVETLIQQYRERLGA